MEFAFATTSVAKKNCRIRDTFGIGGTFMLAANRFAIETVADVRSVAFAFSHNSMNARSVWMTLAAGIRSAIKAVAVKTIVAFASVGAFQIDASRIFVTQMKIQRAFV